MKKMLISTICSLTLLLTSCSLFNPTPKLVKQYDRLDFEYSEASHEDWSRKYLSDEWEYKSDNYGDGKTGNYFHLYKNNELVFNYESADYFNVEEVLVKNNKVYFILCNYSYISEKDVFNISINYIDEEFKHHKIYETTDYNLNNLKVDTSLFFVESKRGSTSNSNIVEIDFEGNVINRFSVNFNDAYLIKLSYVDEENLLVETKGIANNYFLYERNGAFIKKLASLPKDLYAYSVSYENNNLYILGYKKTIKDFDLQNLCIQEYKDNELKTIFDIDIPEDYGYYLTLFEKYNDDVYASFSVSEKGKSKSLYSRHLVLKCNAVDNTINTIYKNINLSHNVFYNNGHIYLGNFTNDYVNNEHSGDFIDIDLNQFNK